MRHGLVLVTVCSFLAVGCTSSLDKNDSLVAWAATSVALSQGQVQAQTAASGMAIVEGQGTSFRGLGVHPRAGANVNADVTCMGGGTARYVGSAESVLDDVGTSNLTFDLAAEFDACSVNNITISGDLEYSLAVEGTADSVKLKSTMKGSLSYEGQIDGSCDWNLVATVAASSDGSVAAEYSGSICGHEAAATLKVNG